MKIKSLLSVFALGIVSQFMIGCNSSKQYFDFGLPTTAAYQKAAPQAEPETIITAAPELATVVSTEVTPAPKAVAAQPILEAKAGKASASADVARTAPLTTAAVEKALSSSPEVSSKVNELAESKSKKDLKSFTKQLKKEIKSVKKSSALNNYVKLGIILILVGVLISILPKLALLGSVVAVIGIVFLVLGLLEML